ncbi:hypothetical protein ILFOPFJJ_04936 [Ensifer psoraleae]|nr:hypothetical protein [Sinorhizobium psoraleae]
MTRLRPVTSAGPEIPHPARIKAGVISATLRVSAIRCFIVLPFDCMSHRLGPVHADFENGPGDGSEDEPAAKDLSPEHHHSRPSASRTTGMEEMA